MSSSTNFLLSIEDLTVSFDGFRAVDGLNLYVGKNELRVIIGPNGAGKTTVLDMVCGKTRPKASRIPSTSPPPHRSESPRDPLSADPSAS